MTVQYTVSIELAIFKTLKEANRLAEQLERNGTKGIRIDEEDV